MMLTFFCFVLIRTAPSTRLSSGRLMELVCFRAFIMLVLKFPDLGALRMLDVL